MKALNLKLKLSNLSKFLILMMALLFTNIIPVSAEEISSRALPTNYNKGYYYSHGVTNNLGSYNRDWMKSISDDKKISELSIPGTHDTMANYELTHIVRTQAVSLKGQLEAGVRFLDIRCRYDGNRFYINHGPIPLKYTFEDVLYTVQDFLRENPSETVLMRIKQEGSSHSDPSFNSRLLQYLEQFEGLFWDNTRNTSNPNLGEVRGKVVIYKEVQGINIGINYRSLYKQDNYHLTTNWDLYRKWEDVKGHLQAARNGNKDVTYINYLSGSGGSFPYFVASGQSSPEMSAPRLATGLAGPAFSGWYPDFPRGNINDILFEGTNILATENIKNNDGRVGIVVADFIGQGLIDAIISKNDFGTSNHIKVGGVNYYGTERVEAFRINFDFKNKKIYVTNKYNGTFHLGFENKKYFNFKVLDSNKNEKANITLRGQDNPTNYNFNFIDFELGDYIELYHEEPFRLDFENLSTGEQTTKSQMYKITKDGLKLLNKDTMMNSIQVRGFDDKAMLFMAFELTLDSSDNSIIFSNRTKERMRFYYPHSIVFRIRLFDKDTNNVKFDESFRGGDTPSDSKYDYIDGLKYNIGDIIIIEPYVDGQVTVTGNISGQPNKYLPQRYKITEYGLESIPFYT